MNRSCHSNGDFRSMIHGECFSNGSFWSRLCRGGLCCNWLFSFKLIKFVIPLRKKFDKITNLRLLLGLFLFIDETDEIVDLIVYLLICHIYCLLFNNNEKKCVKNITENEML